MAIVASGCGGGSPDASNGTTPLIGAAGSVENAAPVIDAISLGCDLVVESVAVAAGSDVSFTLLVDDEAPLALSYSVVSDDETIAAASVSEDGVFTVAGLSVGDTNLPIFVTDNQGLSDQLFLNIIVE